MLPLRAVSLTHRPSTSHSSTTLRNNVLIVVEIDKVAGYGEVGLPPKKPMCYLADFEDIKKYFTEFLHWLPGVLANQHARDYDPFEGLPAQYFAGARQSASLSPLTSILHVRDWMSADATVRS